MDKKTITKEIINLENLHTMTNAYAQISSGRMKNTRDSVLLSRDFLNEIQNIFKELQDSYRQEFLSIARRKGFKKGQKITFLNHNGRSVAVFLSANTAFYGDLTKKVFNLFMKDVEEKGFEATIVGNLGLAMFRQAEPNKSYSYFDLPDYKIDREKLSALVRHLVEYEEIHIYYGKFSSLINQVPDKVIISAETPLTQRVNPIKQTKYLFEPNLEDILSFFETEMFSSIFEQTLRESQLAKFASRMIAMDQASERIKKNLGELKINNSRMIHYISNKKQLESLSSVLGREAAL